MLENLVFKFQPTHGKERRKVPYQPRRQKQQQCEKCNNSVKIMTSRVGPIGTWISMNNTRSGNVRRMRQYCEKNEITMQKKQRQ